VAWWIWALSLAVAASRTTNPLVLGLVIAVAGYVVAARRPATPDSGVFGAFLRLGLVVIAVRVVLFAGFAGTPGTHVLLTLPSAHLPHWLAGLRLGGPVTAEGLLSASYDGLRLAAVLCCVGAANSVTSPRRLLKSLPAALYEAGVAVTVALSVAPQAVATLARLRRARRLRGRPEHGWRAVHGLVVPTLEGSLDGSLELAAAMDARGFGRRGDRPARRRMLAGATTVGGLVLSGASSYGLLVASAPRVLGWPLLAVGAALLIGSLTSSAGQGRTRHRPDRWNAGSIGVAVAGVGAAVMIGAAPLAQLQPVTSPPTVPGLPPLSLVGLAVALGGALGSSALPAGRLRGVLA
jgi:energy-coupling factor transport system permease protein